MASSEPIDALAEPKTRTCRRLSVYFVNGQAQDFNLYDIEDEIEFGEDRWVITRKDGLEEGVLPRNINFYRYRTLEVPVPKKREAPRADI